MPTTPNSAPLPDANRNAIPAWLVVWGLGAVGVAAWATAMVWRRSRWLTTTTSGVDGERLAAIVEGLSQELGVSPPATVVSDSNLGPALCGVFRPTLVLPRCVVEGAGPEDLRPILLHELVHLRRGDHLVAGLQFVVQSLWWFHPLMWWANRRICRVRESCCDAETVRALRQPPRRYARALVEVLDAKQRVLPVFGYPGVRPVEVTARRIQEILTMSDRFLARTPVTYWLAALLAAAVALPGGRLGGDDVRAAETEPAAGEAAKPTSGAAAKPGKPVLLLKYGDDKPDGKKSIAGAGEMIRFTMPKGQTNALRALRVHAARYGHPQPPKEDVEITILSEDMKEPIHTELVPYSLFKRQAECRWTVVPLDDPVEVPETFWVVLNFNAESTKGVYVSYDTSTKGEHSRTGFNDEDAKETEFKGDWMVQAMLAK